MRRLNTAGQRGGRASEARVVGVGQGYNLKVEATDKPPGCSVEGERRGTAGTHRVPATAARGTTARQP